MNQQPDSGDNKDPEEEPVAQSVDSSIVISGAEKPVDPPEPIAAVSGEEEVVTSSDKTEDSSTPMEEDSVNPATVFCIRLKQPRSNLQHKMSVPELCRNFRSELKFNLFVLHSQLCGLAFTMVFIFFVISVLLLGVGS